PERRTGRVRRIGNGACAGPPSSPASAAGAFRSDLTAAAQLCHPKHPSRPETRRLDTAQAPPASFPSQSGRRGGKRPFLASRRGQCVTLSGWHAGCVTQGEGRLKALSSDPHAYAFPLYLTVIALNPVR